MKTKHTPAPWVQEGYTDDGDFFIYNDDTGETVLEIRHGVFNDNNLSLILSAPLLIEENERLKASNAELLDALTDIFNDVMYLGVGDEINDSFQKATRAIDKATQ